MRRLLTAALVLGAFAIVFIDAPAAEESTAAAVVQINVRIGCNGEAVGEFTINNQSATLSKRAGDTAMFSLLGGSDVDSVTVRPKADVAWPFADAPPTFSRGNDRGTGSILADIAPGIYGYDLLVTCGSTEDVIDPNMDIDA